MPLLEETPYYNQKKHSAGSTVPLTFELVTLLLLLMTMALNSQIKILNSLCHCFWRHLSRRRSAPPKQNPTLADKRIYLNIHVFGYVAVQ